MSEHTLTLLDATGIQEYIFGSNQLAQNIGASELVERVTTQWLVESLKVLGLSSNLNWSDDTGVAYKAVADPQVEVIYAGGGNAVLLFAPDTDPQALLRYHTRRVLKEARGLQILAVSQTFKWDEKAGTGEAIMDVLSVLRKEIFKRKMSRPASTPMPGLAITAACAYTGLPAIGVNTDRDIVGIEIAERMKRLKEEQPISGDVADKLRAEPPAKERLHKLLQQVRENGFEFVYDFDQFGEKGESSYIAVVHTDGNGMGKRFETLAEKHKTVLQNRQYITDLRALSDSVRVQAQKALVETVNFLIKGVINGEITIKLKETRMKDKDGNWMDGHLLPFRPIVFGGDDVTFVCDGRLGLMLAAKYLQAFTDGNLADGKAVYARAGVAVVKTHFPFSRAYGLSEDLAGSAKQAIAELKLDGDDGATVLDWHFSSTGIIRSLETIRMQDYLSRSGVSMLMRPIRIDAHAGQWRSWETFQSTMKEFRAKEWAGKRNKIKDLQNALRGGSQDVSLFMKNYRIKGLPDIPAQPGMKMNGWQMEKGKDIACGYFDTLEAIDFVAVKAKKVEL